MFIMRAFQLPSIRVAMSRPREMETALRCEAPPAAAAADVSPRPGLEAILPAASVEAATSPPSPRPVGTGLEMTGLLSTASRRDANPDSCRSAFSARSGSGGGELGDRSSSGDDSCAPRPAAPPAGCARGLLTSTSPLTLRTTEVEGAVTRVSLLRPNFSRHQSSSAAMAVPQHHSTAGATCAPAKAFGETTAVRARLEPTPQMETSCGLIRHNAETPQELPPTCRKLCIARKLDHHQHLRRR